jgi:hypothetical protein
MDLSMKWTDKVWTPGHDKPFGKSLKVQIFPLEIFFLPSGLPIFYLLAYYLPASSFIYFLSAIKSVEQLNLPNRFVSHSAT